MAVGKTMVFDPLLEFCPACGGDQISHGVLRSVTGFMSIADVDHSRCKNCGTYFVNPQPSDESLELFYTSHATEEFIEDNILHRSVERYFDGQCREYFLANRIRPLEKYVTRGCRSLDIGCGAGVFVRFMKDLGYEAEGIDISERSICFGRDKLQLEENIQLRHWSEVRDGGYDLITAWTLIEHVKGPEGLVKKTATMLSKNGVLVLDNPTVDSLLFRHLKEGFFWVMPYYHLFLFSRKGVRAMLERCGFEVLEEYNMPRNWYFVASVCKSEGVDVEAFEGSQFSRVAKRIDEIFDDIALSLGESSTVQFIARLSR